MLSVENPNVVNEYKDKAKKILNTKGNDADVETINEKARVLYNTDLIEKNLAAAKKNRKLDRNLTVIRNEEDFTKLIDKIITTSLALQTPVGTPAPFVPNPAIPAAAVQLQSAATTMLNKIERYKSKITFTK